MDQNAERNEPHPSGKSENPHQQWWDSLPATEQKSKLSNFITNKKFPLVNEKIQYSKTDPSKMFAAKRGVDNDDRASFTEIVDRAHYVPDAKNQTLIESGSAQFIYQKPDKKSGSGNVDLPVTVTIEKKGEAAVFVAGLDTSEQTANGKIDRESLILRPRDTANNRNRELLCDLTVDQGGQHLGMAFNPGNGKLTGYLEIGDLTGKGSITDDILANGVRFDVNNLRSYPVRQNGLTAVNDGKYIVVTREFEGPDGEIKNEVILKTPIAVDVKQGQEKLLGFGVLERPYDAHPDEDTFMETSFTEAFGIEFTPLSKKTIRNLQQLQNLFKRDKPDDEL